MAINHYDWSNGPDAIQQHSIAKHRILESYLSAYFQTLGSSPHQDVLRLTLVDGFAGGGRYYHNDTRKLVWGSPFICLNSTREAGFRINQNRHKPLHLDVSYFFIEANRNAFLHLQKTLHEEGYSKELGQSIHIRHSKFQDEADGILQFIRKKSPRNGRSIFVLDQYGYKEVPTTLVQKIFKQLPSAEVILTFAVDSLLNFASDKALTQDLMATMGISDLWMGQRIEEIKSERDWRLLIQSALYRNLITACGAEYFTPFFVRNKKGHGDYWLIHMSQHHRARDVMTEVHWDNQNYFIHYGGAGLNMFQMVGYDPDRDSRFKGQTELGFEFDNVAKEASVASLMEHIPRLVYANDEGLSFGELFAKTCNGSPASANIYREALGQLIDYQTIIVEDTDGRFKRSPQQIRDTDRILPSRQRKLFG